MKSLFIFVLFSLEVLAQSRGRPPGFKTPSGNAVFPDFITADYDIEYDLQKKTAKVTAKIKFKLDEPGLPIFDSITVPKRIEVNGKVSSQKGTSSPEKVTKYRVIQTSLPKGTHEMKIEVPMDQEYLNPLLKMKKGKVENKFSFSDNEERSYLELFLPSSFEYDQVKMNFNVHFKNTKVKHKIYANGVVKEKENGSFSVSFPDYFTSSSPFFHVIPEDDVQELRFELRSIDGRKIPAVVYYVKSKDNINMEESLKKVVDIATKTLEEMEANFGAYPHDVFMVSHEGIFGDDEPFADGMEYCGAMNIGGIASLRHEIIHSFFGRGILPANGNAGWLDEALTVWATNGYETRSSPPDKSEGLASLSPHHRHHHTGGYHQGAEFIAYLNGKIPEGLFPLLRHLIEKKKLKTITTEEFQQELTEFSSESVDEDFRKYVYGKKE